jgi:hypothetical protein
VASGGKWLVGSGQWRVGNDRHGGIRLFGCDFGAHFVRVRGLVTFVFHVVVTFVFHVVVTFVFHWVVTFVFHAGRRGAGGLDEVGEIAANLLKGLE